MPLIVIAPNAFKGSLTAPAAAAAMAAGVRAAWPQADTILVPLADGGEGTADILVAGIGGRWVECTVTGPIRQSVHARFGILGDGTAAVIEMAAASGLTLVPPESRNPLTASTFGTGQLIQAALDRGCRRIILGIGGSATVDGGVGMLMALGGQVVTIDGAPVDAGGGALAQADRIDLGGLDPRLAAAEILVACDVDNPLLGPNGAAAVYGPQKGASPAMVAQLERNLARLADLMVRDLGKNVAHLPGAGAAGGLGAGAAAFLGARLAPGVDIVMDALHIDQNLARASLVLTGEGQTDGQTLAGKVPLGVARRAARYGVPAVAISGAITDAARALHQQNFAALFSIAPGPIALNEAMAQAGPLLTAATTQAIRMYRLGIETRA